MLFNSFEYLVFLPLVFLGYWVLLDGKTRFQNIFLIVVSYIFYGWWDVRFLSLLVLSTGIDFCIGLGFLKFGDVRRRKILLSLSIISNLGILGFFKYYNFFLDNLILVLHSLGFQTSTHSLSIILPVGISFYTFQTMSYTLDVYKNKIRPTNDIFAFAAFVSFFPQLVAGPIERASKFLSQFLNQRKFSLESAQNGLKQILWGFFKKLVIADNCAFFADTFFNNSDIYPGSALLFGTIFFSIQIYCDFSGYTDIAIGTARLFGFELMKNFNFPYFSRNIAEFWRRWHISLTTWFRDYVYIPLGGSRRKKIIVVRNVFLVFLISGFWHGPKWTFIIWGTLHAILYLPSLLNRSNRKYTDATINKNMVPSFHKATKMFSTFLLVSLLWIPFRAENLEVTFSIFKKIFSNSLFATFELKHKSLFLITILISIGFFVVEWLGRNSEYAIENLLSAKKTLTRWSFYSFILFLIGMFMQTSGSPFIYFQF